MYRLVPHLCIPPRRIFDGFHFCSSIGWSLTYVSRHGGSSTGFLFVHLSAGPLTYVSRHGGSSTGFLFVHLSAGPSLTYPATADLRRVSFCLFIGWSLTYVSRHGGSSTGFLLFMYRLVPHLRFGFPFVYLSVEALGYVSRHAGCSTCFWYEFNLLVDEKNQESFLSDAGIQFRRSNLMPSTKTTTESETDTLLLRVFGARTNNLKDIDVNIPHNQLVCITGRSGSGKSSLAFDTIFAEGQRQYIESLSIYSRQFFNQLARADVDLIEGLRPTISLEQRPSASNRRSTVGTVTEIYDFLRVLLARTGDIHCHECGQPIRQQTPQQIRDGLLDLPEATKVMILSPLVMGRKGKHEDVFAKVRRERLVRVRVDSELHDIDRLPELNARKKHTIEAVTDRIIIREGIGKRVLEAVELAARLSDGRVLAIYRSPEAEDWQEQLFSTQYACPSCNVSYAEIQPRTFSFNSPYGACPECEGLGVTRQFDPEMVIPDRSKSLAQGAVVAWAGLTKAAVKKQLAQLQPIMQQVGLSDSDTLSGLTTKRWNEFLNSRDKTRPGLLLVLDKELATCSKEERIEQLEELSGEIECRSCHGSRVHEQARAVCLNGKHVGQILEMSLADASLFFESIELEGDRAAIAAPLLKEINKRLKFLNDVGVSYLTLGRSADSLSGGEHQRVRLATSIGSGLTNVCYVLDEPSIGLHPRDNDRLIGAIRELKAAGNSIIVVEHDEKMMRTADHLIDVGYGAGGEGGQVVAQGTPSEVAKSTASLTGKYLRKELMIDIPHSRRKPKSKRMLRIRGARGHNLQNIDVDLPLGLLVCVTGVSGSGKSTLINQTLWPVLARRQGLLAARPLEYKSITGDQQIDKLVRVDQRPIGRTPRGCAATYSGVFDEIRTVFAATPTARQRGFTASRFSFNSKMGWCPDCQGHGQRRMSMNFLPDIFVTCETCNGRRFNLQTLQVRYRDMTIADVLELPIAEATNEFVNFSRIHAILQSLTDVGLGYLPLGQPSTTLSGGESQRIKLATELARKHTGNTLYLLDEPTTGLHFEDIRGMLSVLNGLVDLGNTVVVIEHNLDVIKSADWLIDLGPEGGQRGGQLMAAGTPEMVVQERTSVTGKFLQELI